MLFIPNHVQDAIKLPEFFKDDSENEDEKRSGKKRGQWRLKKFREQQPGGVKRNDGDQRTFHFCVCRRVRERVRNQRINRPMAPPAVSMNTSETCAVRVGTKRW